MTGKKPPAFCQILHCPVFRVEIRHNDPGAVCWLPSLGRKQPAKKKSRLRKPETAAVQIKKDPFKYGAPGW